MKDSRFAGEEKDCAESSANGRFGSALVSNVFENSSLESPSPIVDSAAADVDNCRIYIVISSGEESDVERKTENVTSAGDKKSFRYSTLPSDDVRKVNYREKIASSGHRKSFRNSTFPDDAVRKVNGGEKIASSGHKKSFRHSTLPDDDTRKVNDGEKIGSSGHKESFRSSTLPDDDVRKVNGGEKIASSGHKKSFRNSTFPDDDIRKVNDGEKIASSGHKESFRPSTLPDDDVRKVNEGEKIACSSHKKSFRRSTLPDDDAKKVNDGEKIASSMHKKSFRNSTFPNDDVRKVIDGEKIASSGHKKSFSPSTLPDDDVRKVNDAEKIASSGHKKSYRHSTLPTEGSRKANYGNRGFRRQISREKNEENGKAEDALAEAASDSVQQVKRTLQIFHKLYLHYVQEDQGCCMNEEDSNSVYNKRKRHQVVDELVVDKRKKTRRPDLKAIKEMKNNKTILHTRKIIGHVPGVSVGDQFFSRCEMIAIGLHDHWLSGIDFMGPTYSSLQLQYKFPIAVSLVLSGVYEDDVDNSNDVVYTGQGGNDFSGKKRQIADQTMDRGNLALKNSMEQKIPVRLIRGHRTTKCHKVYTYDGIYQVIDFWLEKGISGFSVYKFRLHRVEGQPALTTDQVHFYGGQALSGISQLKGLICIDISNGLERHQVPATNIIDDPPFPPSGFKYIPENEVDDRVAKPLPAKGCSCQGDCTDVRKCACAALNKGKFPYVKMHGGLLVEPVDVVYECGPQCACGPGCSNRVTQRGLYYRLEVFRTPSKGWAVRSWDPIPAGAPVCEYTGLLMRTEDADNISGNDYIFDLDCLQTMKGLGVRQRRMLVNAEGSDENQSSHNDNIEGPEYCIDAGSSGNVARFINHSCEPNLFVQCVLNTHHDLTQPRVFLFASENIHPLKELAYDYGYELDSVVVDGKVKRLPCHCGASECRKRLY